MIRIRLIFVIGLQLLFTLLLSAQKLPPAAEKAFKAGEKLKYTVSYSLYMGVDVAELLIKTEQEMLNDKPHHKISARVIVYNYYETLMNGDFGYQSVIDQSTFLPKLYLRYFKRNNTEEKRIVILNQAKQLAVEKDTKKKFKIGTKSHDMMSVLFYLRSLDFEKATPGTVIPANMIVSNSTYDISFKYVGKEEVKLKAGNIICYKISPRLPQNLIDGFNKFSPKNDKLIKSNDQINFFLSADKNKVPVKFSTVTNLGTIEVLLYQYEQLAQQGLLK